MGRPARPLKSPPNHLRKLRLAAGLTMQQLAAAVGEDNHQTIEKLEIGKNRLTAEWRERLAAPLRLDDPDELLLERDRKRRHARVRLFGRRMVPVVGKVGAGAQVFPIDDYAKGAGLDEIACPPDLNPDTTVAVQVEGDSMFPLETGWILFYSRAQDVPPAELVGHLCIVKIANDGPTLVKQLRRGHQRGRFNLLSSNAPLIENAVLEWAARVTGLAPPA
jgi:phage repressor protein C with HTH and peptisase S24 domain